MKKSGEKVQLYSWQNAVLMVLTLLFALIGTRALFVYQNSDFYSWKVFRNWQSGFVLYGGLIVGVAAGCSIRRCAATRSRRSRTSSRPRSCSRSPSDASAAS